MENFIFCAVYYNQKVINHTVTSNRKYFWPKLPSYVVDPFMQYNGKWSSIILKSCVWTPQNFYCMLDHFSTCYIKGWSKICSHSNVSCYIIRLWNSLNFTFIIFPCSYRYHFFHQYGCFQISSNYVYVSVYHNLYYCHCYYFYSCWNDYYHKNYYNYLLPILLMFADLYYWQDYHFNHWYYCYHYHQKTIEIIRIFRIEK